MLGAAAGFVVVRVVGAVALHFRVRPISVGGAQSSIVLQRLNELVPPRSLMRALDRVDPFPTIVGPDAPVDPPDPRRPRAGVRQAAPSVLRSDRHGVCGSVPWGPAGSARIPSRIAAHVVAGQTDTTVEPAGVRRAHGSCRVLRPPKRSPRSCAFRPRCGAARGCGTESGVSVAILGLPESGAFTVTPARIGSTATVLARDAYAAPSRERSRACAAGSGTATGRAGGRHRGRVQTTVFAARPGGEVGYGIPATIVRRAPALTRRYPRATALAD